MILLALLLQAAPVPAAEAARLERDRIMLTHIRSWRGSFRILQERSG